MSETSKSSGLNKAKIADWAILAVIVSLLGWAAISTFHEAPLRQLVGEPAPAFKLKTRSGDVRGPVQYQGHVVLLDFWATWCNPCFRQMPILAEVEEQVGDELVVLPVNIDEPSANRKSAIDAFLKEAGTERDTLMDTGAVSGMYGVETIPALVLIDPDGIVRWTGSGVTARERLVAEVKAAGGGDE
jgi:thiol-disulfide isomerase/thioredoxin